MIQDCRPLPVNQQHFRINRYKVGLLYSFRRSEPKLQIAVNAVKVVDVVWGSRWGGPHLFPKFCIEVAHFR